MGLEFTKVVSSNIDSYRYDPETNVLDIIFANQPDTVFSFDDVPQNVADGFKTAGSVGQYFRNNVKGRYRFLKG